MSERYAPVLHPVTWRDYIVADPGSGSGAGGRIVAVRMLTGSTLVWSYLVGDHLNSPTSIADTATPPNVERDSYDAWGERRNADATDDSGCTLSSQLPRGYTGHEMLDQLCLINMNARLYDPGLGIFLQADTVVPNPYSYSGYMRYSYAGNNPLAFVDPSGHDDCEGAACLQLPLPIDPEQPPEEVDVFADRLFTPDGAMLREMQDRNLSGAGGDPRGGGDPAPEQVVVTAPRWQPPNYKTLLPPLPLPWNLPIPNFQFDQDGGDSDRPSGRCNRSVMALGNNTRLAAYSLSGSGLVGTGLGGVMFFFQGDPKGLAVASGSAAVMTFGGYLDVLGAGLQGAANDDYGSAFEAAFDVSFDLAVQQVIHSPYSEFYDFARGVQTAIKGPTLQSCPN